MSDILCNGPYKEQLNEKLTFPEIWVESVCESSGDDDDDLELKLPIKDTQKRALRSLLQATSTDVSFESSFESSSFSSSSSSRQNSFQYDNEESKENNFHTPVASVINDWLCNIERRGFSANVVQAFAKDEIDYDEEDDIWFEQGLVRVFDPYYDIDADDIEEIEDGTANPQTGMPVGVCTVRLKNGDELQGTFRKGLRQGRGSIEGENLLKHGLICVKGMYKDGVLMGLGKAMLVQSSLWNGVKSRVTLEGVFNDGYLEGPVRGLDDRGNLIFVGEYSKGLPKGNCWLAKEGQGWLYGKVDEKGRFSGQDIAYVYPDRCTSMIGQFHQEIMLKSLSSHIVQAELNSAHIMCLSIINTDDANHFTHCPSNNEKIRCDWTLTDCYEDVTVECRTSTVEGAGEGLFAQRNLPAGKIISFYNGILVQPGEKYNTTNFNYQIYVDWSNTDGSAFVDVPNQCTDVSVYRSSLAHKANHSFDPNCKFVAVDHPRFGRIPALQTLKDVKKDEELFSHYKYDMALAPNWYQVAWENFHKSVDDEEKDE